MVPICIKIHQMIYYVIFYNHFAWWLHGTFSPRLRRMSFSLRPSSIFSFKTSSYLLTYVCSIIIITFFIRLQWSIVWIYSIRFMILSSRFKHYINAVLSMLDLLIIHTTRNQTPNNKAKLFFFCLLIN